MTARRGRNTASARGSIGAGVRNASLAVLIGLACAFPVDAAVRYWFLQGVTFDDGTTATGSFAYDDVTRAVTAWNISVGGSASKPVFFPFTYMPGNSTATAFASWTSVPTINFTAPDAGTSTQPRLLRLTPAETLDGTPSTVGLDISGAGVDGNLECTACGVFRVITGGSFALALLPPPPGLVDVVEFYHAGSDHYFITADSNEIQVLDAAVIPGWARTGYSFKAFAAGSGGGGPSINPVCRFFGVILPGVGSHFYSGSALECREVNANLSPPWGIESGNVFQVDLPDATTGACPGGTIPVYRVFSNRPDANHRYMTSAVVRAQMEAAGWVREGYGPDAVILCARAPL